MATRESQPLTIPQGHGRDNITIKPVFLDDDYLLSEGVTHQEVDRIIDGKLHGVQLHFQEPSTSPIARRYGIERPPTLPMERFLAYVEVLDEYRVVRELTLNHASALRDQYDEEKAPFQEQKSRKQIKNKQYRNEINRLQQEKLVPAGELAERSKQAEKIELLILRKAALEFFSLPAPQNDHQQEPLAEHFPGLLSKAIDTMGSNQQQENSHFRERRPIQYFIHQLTRYLATTGDKYLNTQFRYRADPEDTINPNSTQSLQTFIQMAFSPQQFSSDAPSQEQLSNLGNSLLLFLRNRAVRPESRLFTNEPYSTLQLIYDLLTTSLMIGKPSISLQIGHFIDMQFGQESHKATSEDITKIIQTYHLRNRQMIKMYPDLSANDPSKNTILKSYLLLNNLLPDELKTWCFGIEHKIIPAFGTMAMLRRSKKIDFHSPFGNTETIPNLGELMKEKADKIGAEIPHEERIRINNFSAASTFLACSTYTRGIRNTTFIDLLNSTINYEKQTAQAVTSYFEPTTWKKSEEYLTASLQDIYKNLDIGEDKGADSILTALARKNWPVYEFTDKQIETVERENELLWAEVLDNPKWFVSPRGDRYNAQDDEELESKDITFVKFQIDRSHPREHIVSLGVNELPEPLVLWLDTRRNILSRNRQILTSDARIKQTLLNIMLKRLYFITSGLLSEPKEGQTHGEGSGDLIYKRAHYRTLNSTDRRPITMTSHGAQIHAQEILEEYGIDIFAEIRRRRAIGRLGPTQFLTFVRESVPRIQSLNIIPNIIDYDPLAVNLSLRELGLQ